jgi:hypothetical protein
VHLGDRVRRVAQQASRPERITQVVAEILERVRHAAVEDHGAFRPVCLGEPRREPHGAILPALSRFQAYVVVDLTGRSSGISTAT